MLFSASALLCFQIAGTQALHHHQAERALVGGGALEVLLRLALG
jgi:hypothetical protein